MCVCVCVCECVCVVRVNVRRSVFVSERMCLCVEKRVGDLIRATLVGPQCK